MKAMLRTTVTMLLLLTPLASQAGAQPAELEAFAPLVGARWQATGKWSNGSEFEQEIEFKWALNQTMVIAESFGVINPESGARGHRNHGIRAWNAKQKKLWFWEFDVFGGLTEGEVLVNGKDITLQYEYGTGQRRVQLRDRWRMVDEQTYDFSVEQMQDGEWLPLLETQFRRIRTNE